MNSTVNFHRFTTSLDCLFYFKNIGAEEAIKISKAASYSDYISLRVMLVWSSNTRSNICLSEAYLPLIS